MKSFNPDAKKKHSVKLKQFLSDEIIWPDASNVILCVLLSYDVSPYVWQIYLPFHIIILIFFTSQGWAEQSNTFGQYYWSTSKRVVKILGVFHHHTNFSLLRLPAAGWLFNLS